MKSNGMILYQGPSKLNGKPIVVIAIGFAKSSSNRKTGGMIQTYILCDGIDPISAVNCGADCAICGGCIHRKNIHTGTRTCYVTLMHGPMMVYKTYMKGKYMPVDYNLFADRPVRLGTYGDPAAVPADVWYTIKAVAKMTTGYTHQWNNSKIDSLSSICQASCETEQDVAKANAKGYGTFRVLPVLSETPVNAIHCPASEEMGKTTTCVECGMCNGANGYNIAILAHGSTGHKYTGSRTTV